MDNETIGDNSTAAAGITRDTGTTGDGTIDSAAFSEQTIKETAVDGGEEQEEISQQKPFLNI